jgi:hypothetical protein
MNYHHTCEDCGDFFRIGDFGDHKCSKSLLKKRQKARLTRKLAKVSKERQQKKILTELRAIKKLLKDAETSRMIKLRAQAGL